MTPRKPLFFLSSLLVAYSLANNSPKHSSDKTASLPVHEELIAQLRETDAVIPPAPEGLPRGNMSNREAVIPPQCYTRHDQTYNACYVCHQAAIPGRENVMNDDDLQADYSFSDVGLANHWKNLFEDRSSRVEKITDEEITNYVNEDNYSELAGRLKEAEFKGWIPELANLQLGAEAFDEQGFAKDGSQWVAFQYKPFPSTFWPTNGATDDVMIRLAEPFRSNLEGSPCADTYRANLAIVEANLKGLSEITCLPVDEKAVGEDLNGDGELTTIHKVTRINQYVGSASKDRIETHLYPAGTEFLHTVRYLGIDDEGQIQPSTRMKEVRYMKKWRAYSKPVYGRQYELEGFEKEAGNLPAYMNLREHGLDNGNGWSISGFIESYNGRLRALTHEENFSCMGCHNSIGSTIDKTFSFPRKVDGAAGWGYLDLKGMPDVPTQGEQKGEIATYLERVGGGSEFRHNPEMLERWFKPDGSVDHEKIAQAKDVYELITPSRERALMLNKAYKCIVEDQDYIYGKDATVVPPKNVFQQVDNETTESLPADKQYRWNILLDWNRPPSLSRK
ncbi:hypothetical protein [Roseibacillus persicicus]|uniref:Lipoprotein n=1 Tax=Roseibacillus persicicus TaxID=454148 RepID=A0A918TNV7_9BACT|nr:hypothetical protein [Roseibacillus persicicus]GHC56956.1 putative lipoprotein [Roseibacillus persicicus]